MVNLTKHHIDIILPCYNPIPNWANVIVDSITKLQSLEPNIKTHVILINDGSNKGVTEENITYLKEQLPNLSYIAHKQNKGKGHALRSGVELSKNDICIYTDIDFPYTMQSFAAVLHQLNSSSIDVAVGVRDETYYQQVPKARVRISKVFKFFIGQFFRLKVTDTQCGLKGFKNKGKALFLRTTTDRYLFDLEFIQLASKQLPDSLIAVPVELKPNIEFSKMNFPVLAREGISFIQIFIKNLF